MAQVMPEGPGGVQPANARIQEATLFELHPNLARDCFEVTDWPLCRVLLVNDTRFPWVILVPRREALRDFDEVEAEDKPLFYSEIEQATERLRQATRAEKMNVAALGNAVPQLHVHVIARFAGDEAWPGPVWGVGEAVPYEDEQAQALMMQLRDV